MLQWVSMENEGSKMKVGYEMNGEKIKYHKARETYAKYKPMIQLCNELKWRKEGKMEEKKEGKKKKGKTKTIEVCIWGNSTSSYPHQPPAYVQCHAKLKHQSLKSRP